MTQFILIDRQDIPIKDHDIVFAMALLAKGTGIAVPFNIFTIEICTVFFYTFAQFNIVYLEAAKRYIIQIELITGHRRIVDTDRLLVLVFNVDLAHVVIPEIHFNIFFCLLAF